MKALSKGSTLGPSISPPTNVGNEGGDQGSNAALLEELGLEPAELGSLDAGDLDITASGDGAPSADGLELDESEEVADVEGADQELTIDDIDDSDIPDGSDADVDEVEVEQASDESVDEGSAETTSDGAGVTSGGDGAGGGGAGGLGAFMAEWSNVAPDIGWDEEICLVETFEPTEDMPAAAAQRVPFGDRLAMVGRALGGGITDGVLGGVQAMALDTALNVASSKIPGVAGVVELAKLFHDPAGFFGGLAGGGKFGMGLERLASGDPIEMLSGVLDLGDGVNNIIKTLAAIATIVAGVGGLLSFIPGMQWLIPIAVMAGKWSITLGKLSSVVGIVLSLLRAIVVAGRAMDILIRSSDPELLELKADELRLQTGQLTQEYTQRRLSRVRDNLQERARGTAGGDPSRPETPGSGKIHPVAQAMLITSGASADGMRSSLDTIGNLGGPQSAPTLSRPAPTSGNTSGWRGLDFAGSDGGWFHGHAQGAGTTGAAEDVATDGLNALTNGGLPGAMNRFTGLGDAPDKKAHNARFRDALERRREGSAPAATPAQGASESQEPCDPAAVVGPVLESARASLPAPPIQAPDAVDSAAFAHQELLLDIQAAEERAAVLDDVMGQADTQIAELQGMDAVAETGHAVTSELDAEADELREQQQELSTQAAEAAAEGAKGQGEGSKGNGMIGGFVGKFIEVMGRIPRRFVKNPGQGADGAKKLQELGPQLGESSGQGAAMGQAAQAEAQTFTATTEASAAEVGAAEAELSELDTMIAEDQAMADEGAQELEQTQQDNQAFLEALFAERDRLEAEHAATVAEAAAWVSAHRAARVGGVANVEAAVNSVEAA